VELFGRQIDWTSSSTGIATVDPAGLVSGVADGNVVITATSEGVDGTAAITVGVPPAVVIVSAGLDFSCATLTDGHAYCWGFNGLGQLGDGTTNSSVSPVLVVGGASYTGVSVAHDGSSGIGDHTCGLTDTGVIDCWGGNSLGQLGDGTNSNSSVPQTVAGGLTFVHGDAGGRHNCAIDDAGLAWCWGDNGRGQLGDGTSTNSNQPVAVSGSMVFFDISAGTNHSCGIVEADGSVWCWGGGSLGQLGDGLQSNSDVPVKISSGAVFLYVTAGDRHSCAVDEFGDAYCWGWNVNGQLGVTSQPDQCLGTEACEDVPVLVSGGQSWNFVSAGHRFTCGLNAAEEALCWGANANGKLGAGADPGSLGESTAPLAVAGGMFFGEISAGRDHACGVTVNGVAYCWGRGDEGQLGNGSQTAINTSPVRVGAPLQ
jgi:alpha-tubulin suppressor-like RCC1 family protein